MVLNAESDIPGRLGKINPPLRDEECNLALWEAVNDGTISFVGSDHCSTTQGMAPDLWAAPPGSPGVETLLPIMLSEGINKGRITLETLVEILCTNNARVFDIYPQKGTIAVGSDADLVILDLDKKVALGAAQQHYTLSDYSPYEGWEVTGWPVLTMVRGKVVVKGRRKGRRARMGPIHSPFRRVMTARENAAGERVDPETCVRARRGIRPAEAVMSKTFYFLLLLLIPSIALAAQTAERADLKSYLDSAVSRAMSAGRIPALSMAVVAGDEVIWTGGWGMSNLWARTPAGPETVYLIGSIVKTMQAVALLQLVEQGKLALDDPVSSYLDEIEIRGEDPQNPITFRHLLTHSSGIPGQAEKGAFPDEVDEVTKRVIPYWDRPFQAYPIWGYILPPPIEEYLRVGLKATRPPLERVEYSPMALTLVAYVTEKLSGVPYMQAIRQNIFDPIEMTRTAFIPTADMDERFALPYVYDEEKGKHVPLSRVRVAIWATGQVYGTVGNLANWLITNLNGGTFRGTRILGAETLAQAHEVQFDQLRRTEPDGGSTGWGLGWNVTERGGERFISHSGSLPGETAFVLANLTRKVGVAILSNGNRAHPHLSRLAYETLKIVAPSNSGSSGGSGRLETKP